MIIDTVGQSAYPMTMPLPATAPEKDDVVMHPAASDQADEPSSAMDETVGEAEEPVNDADKTKGVLRLLQAGHFCGVADVRLRVNFHEEIAALERQRFAQAAQEGVTDIQASIDGLVGNLLENPELADPAATGINEALDTFNTALATITETGIVNAVEMTDRINNGFDDFVSSLRLILGVPAEAEPETTGEVTVPADNPGAVEDVAVQAVTEEEAVVEAETAQEQDYQAFIADLIDVFQAKLQELEQSLTQIRVLPELSEPHGKGGAYDKFVVMYNNLVAPPTESTEPAVDTNA